MRCGVVLFDSANNITIGDKTFASLDNGWASAGGDQAVRISSIHDLSSDVLWVTNLTEEQFYRATLMSHPNFRSEGYLRSSLRHIYSELGVDPQFVSPDVVASTLATVVQRTVDLACNRYGVRPRSKALNEDYAYVLNAPRSQLPAEIYGMFEGSAQHSYVRTVATNNYLNNGQTLTLRRNRLIHARELLSMPVPPDTHWEYIAKDRLPASKRGIESLLSQSETAFLVCCEVKRISPAIAEVFSVGSGARTIRNWLTDVEWRRIYEWAEIDYNGLLLCGTPSAPVSQHSLLPSGEYAALSFTCGLTAEQIWTAMTMKRGGRDDHRYTAAAAWFRAADRMAMLSYAQKLHSRGLNVWGYGGGNVVVMYPEGGLRHSLDVITDIGLMAPANKLLEARRAHPEGTL
ncbi:hypothetical protein RCH14_004526 [Massilia sp. MP_M2]|uniref:hypothetical protein n=1 Tax=Massilia sp. MP_M2 TaxID=3071713 RepID=UPI00319E9C79